MQINFDGADIAEVVKVVLGDLLGATYSMDPTISGEVMLSSSGPLDRAALVSMLEMALRMNGATLTRTGANRYAITVQDNILGAVETSWLGGSAPPRVAAGNGVTIVPLRFVGATSAAQFVQPLLSRPENVRIDETRNLLLFSGPGSERQMVLDTLAEIDVDWMAGRSVGIFPLKMATPEAMIPELEALIQPLAGGQGGDATIRFLEMARLNAVLAIANRPEQIVEIERWVERLDRGSVTGIQFFVYQLQHVPAEDVATILTNTFGEGGELASNERIVGLDRGNAAGSTDGFMGQNGGLDTPPVDPAGAFGSAAGENFGGTAGGNPLAGVRIVPNPLNNTLLIRATPQAYRMIEATLRRLDTAPLQVLIEATIAEVTLNDTLRYGVQYFLDTGSIKAGFNTTTPSTGVVDPGQLNPLARLPGFNFVATPGSSNITIDALARITDVKVLSSPSVVVQDNSEAVLNVGDEVPITTRSAISVDDPNAPVVNNIEYRDTGVILEVKPRISSNEVVALDISQEVSRVAVESTSSDSLTPVISQRKITSHINIQSGQTVVLGGLIQDSDTRSKDKIPLLGDVPVLGNLFSSTSNQNARTELIVFITPKIVRNPADARDVSNELRSKMRSIRPAPQGPLIDHESGKVIEPAMGPSADASEVQHSQPVPRQAALPLHPEPVATPQGAMKASLRELPAFAVDVAEKAPAPVPAREISTDGAVMAMPAPRQTTVLGTPDVRPSISPPLDVASSPPTPFQTAMAVSSGSPNPPAAIHPAMNPEPVRAVTRPAWPASRSATPAEPVFDKTADTTPDPVVAATESRAASILAQAKGGLPKRLVSHAPPLSMTSLFSPALPAGLVLAGASLPVHPPAIMAGSEGNHPMVSSRREIERRLSAVFGTRRLVGPFAVDTGDGQSAPRVLVEKLLGKPVFHDPIPTVQAKAPAVRETIESPDIASKNEPSIAISERLMAVERLPFPKAAAVEPATGGRKASREGLETRQTENRPAADANRTADRGGREADPSLERIKPVRACDIYFSREPSRDAAIHDLMQRLCNRVS
ncbi:MAG: type II secretion system secretin GspD [Geminicoccaceae bacterium]